MENVNKNNSKINPTPGTSTADESYERSDNWEVVTNRKHRRRKHNTVPMSIKGSAKNTEVSGVEVRKYVHGCFFRKDSTPESIISHLKSIRDGFLYTVEQIPSKHDTYKSFKIGIPITVYDDFLTTTAWPINTCITEWRPFLRPRETKSPQTN